MSFVSGTWRQNRDLRLPLEKEGSRTDRMVLPTLTGWQWNVCNLVWLLAIIYLHYAIMANIIGKFLFFRIQPLMLHNASWKHLLWIFSMAGRLK